MNEVKKHLNFIKKFVKTFFKVLGITIAALLLLVVGLFFFIRSPWGQDIIVQKAVAYLSKKTGTEIRIDRLFVTFRGDLYLEGLYVEDLNQDTLLYSKKLETGLALKTFIREGEISVSKLEWEGVKARVKRDSISQEFNFDFILAAFVSEIAEVEEIKQEPNPFPGIAIGPVDLTDFNLIYDDQVLGIQAQAVWDKIRIRAEHLDLNKMDFGISDLLISDSRIDYYQYKPFEPKEEEEASDVPLPVLVLDRLQLSHADWSYVSLPDGIKAKAQWESLSLSLPEGNLEDQKVLLKYLQLADADIQLELTGPEGGEAESIKESSDRDEVSLPDWWIEVGNIDLENTRIAFIQSDGKIIQGQFNPDAILLEDFNFSAHSIFLKEDNVGIHIDDLKFKEGSGLSVKEFQGQLSLEEKGIKIRNFTALTGKTNLKLDLGLAFSDLNYFLENPEKADLDLDLREFKSDLTEVLYFSPELGDELYFQELMGQGISAKGKVSGNINRLQIPDFLLNYGEQSFLKLESAVLLNFMDMDALRYEIPRLELVTQSSVLQPYLPELDYNFPEDIRLLLDAKGGLQDAIANLVIITTDGNIRLNGNLDTNGIYRLESVISLEHLDIGKIMNIPDLAPLTLASHISGSGSGPYDVQGMLTLDIDQLVWKDKDFSALEFQLTAQDTLAELTMAFKEEYVDFALDARASLDSLNPGLDLNLVIDNIQTKALGLTDKDITGKLKMKGSVDGTLDSLSVKLTLLDSYLKHEKKTYPIGDFNIGGLISDVNTELRIDSDFLEGFFKVDASFEELVASINNYLEEINTGNTGSLEVKDMHAEANLWFHPTPIIDKLLVDGLEEMDTLFFDFSYGSGQKTFSSRVDLNKVVYNGAVLDSFLIDLKGDDRSIQFQTVFKKFKAGPIDMPETNLMADYQQKSLDFEFISKDNEGVIIDVYNHLDFSSDTLYFHVRSEGLIFNRESWLVPSKNQVAYASDYLFFEDFSFSKNSQNITFTNSINQIEEEHIGLLMRNFELNTLFGFLNPYKPLFSGNANGELVLVNPFGALGIIADLNIQEIEVIDIPFGRLDLNAQAKSLQEYDFFLSLKEGMADLELVGAILIDAMGSNLDMKLDLHALKVELLELLSGGELKEAKGIITGRIALSGAMQQPQYQGELNFMESSFVVSQLNNRLNFPDESIKINNSGLSFTDFSIVDEGGQEFTINGKVLTGDFTNIGFDLKLFAENFQLLNSTRADNDLFFGKALVDLDLQIGGNMELPVINAKVKVNKGTNLTLILPEDQLNYMERTGIVLFVNHEDPYDILYQRDAEIVAKGVQGFDITANLQIDPQTIINIIVDERTNDNLRLQGEADLSLQMDPNGDISLSGRYEIGSGHYELNLFGLVNRRFLFAPGSTIIWTGDVLDANLNITTIYNVRTSPAELMQAQLSGTTTDTRSQFRQVLPFMVYLKISGELVQPEIAFELDMPEESRGSFDGNVYSMVQQVNQREDELNKQVFSLLVLNQFFPMMGNDGSSGGSVNLAKSSASQILSSQLNTFSDRIFGDTGFSIDFDLDTYTDYQTGAAEDRTQLNVAAKQKLMDDRLIISVGSQVNVDGGNQQAQQGNTVFGDVSLEYLLDERGRWRVTTFRKNQFESVIDGQLIITGVSFIFNKEFNSFLELLKKSEEEKSRDEKKKDKKEKGDGDMVPKEKDEAILKEENDIKN